MEFITDLYSSYTLQIVSIGVLILGVVSGTLSTFALLRKQSLIGDAVSHAALPGVVIAFIITHSRESWILMLGAMVSGWLATMLIIAITRNTQVKQDGALGVALTFFFGLGLLLLGWSQTNLAHVSQAGLDHFLFGQAATLVRDDVITMGVVGSVSILGIIIFWKEFKLISFDRDYAASMGYPVQAIEIGLTTLLVIAIVIGLKAVGVVLMSSMIVAPAAAARQWTNRLSLMAIISAAFGAIAGLSGAIASSFVPRLSTGPVIVLCISGIAVFSLIFAPARGLFWKWVRQRRNQERLRIQQILTDLYRLERQHDFDLRGHSVSALQVMSAGKRGVRYTLDALAQDEFVQEKDGLWRLTDAGTKRAKKIIQTNLQSQTDLTEVQR